MEKLYPAVVHHEDDGYWVEFPTLKGCLTEGNTLNGACLMAKDALKEWINEKKDIGNAVPEPVEIEDAKKQYPNDKVIAIEYDDNE